MLINWIRKPLLRNRAFPTLFNMVAAVIATKRRAIQFFIAIYIRILHKVCGNYGERMMYSKTVPDAYRMGAITA
jgi:hypothetical protein